MGQVTQSITGHGTLVFEVIFDVKTMLNLSENNYFPSIIYGFEKTFIVDIFEVICF